MREDENLSANGQLLAAELAQYRTNVQPGTIIRFVRNNPLNPLNDHRPLTYAAIFVAGVWYVTGTLAGRRTFSPREFYERLGESDISLIEIATDWAAI